MVPPDRPRAGARRIADVALRHLGPGGRARVHWPAPCADPTVAALVVLVSPDDDLVGELLDQVAELAVDEGWPPLRHVALLWPHHDPTSALDGLTRALAVPSRQQKRSAR